MPKTKVDAQSDLSDTQRERREFMEKAGKLAAYTPPIMLGLLLPGQHAIASGTQSESTGSGGGSTGSGGGSSGFGC
jgi:hypothetical protein